MPDNSIDVSALVGWLGKYQKSLYNLMYNSLDVFKDVKVVPNLKSKLQMTRLRVNKSGRPYTGVPVVQTGDLEYLPRELSVDKGQRDLLFHPDDYRGTFLEEFTTGAGGDAKKKEIPFAAYTWQQIFGQLAADINDRVAYHGLAKADFAAWDNGTAYSSGDLVTFVQNSATEYFRANQSTSAAESPDTHPAKWDNVTMEATAEGFGSRLAKAITAASVTETSIGVIDNSSIYALAAFKELWRKLGDPYKKAGAHIYCSFTDAELLLDDIESKLSKYTREDVTQGKSNMFALPGTFGKGIVHPVTWMAGSRRIIVTPKENMLVGTDRLSDLNSAEAIREVYTVKAGITWLFGTQIRDFDADCFVVNDQA